MTTTTKTHAVVVAEMRDGTILFVPRLRSAEGKLTSRRNLAWVTTPEEALETVYRFHAVQALGHFHQDVQFYRVARVARPRSWDGKPASWKRP